jgi:calcineurin-like phosphoesterase family protein
VSDVFFTADTHFAHAKIVELFHRPFATVEEMDEELIKRWNVWVRPGDIVYHLGDFAYRRPGQYLDRLNGRAIHLIRGNHDDSMPAYIRERFASVSDMKRVKVGDQEIVLCHYAMRVWNKSHHGAWHLYGHSHGTLRDDPNALSLDVGVDCWNFCPVPLERVEERMAKKAYAPVDHHGEEDET